MCVTQWIRLACLVACKKKNGILLGKITEYLIATIPLLSSTDAKKNLLSLMINTVETCVTSTEARYLLESNRKCLEFLMKYYMQHSHPQKASASSDMLFNTFQACLQFDLSDLEAKQNDFIDDGNLFDLICKMLVFCSDSRQVFDMVLDACTKMFVESEGPVFALAIKHRSGYLSYLTKTWPLFSGKDFVLGDEKLAMLMFICIGHSPLELPSDVLRQLVKSNACELAVCLSGCLKRYKLFEDRPKLYMPALKRYGTFMESHFSPVVLDAVPCMLDSVHNGLFLKLHLISSTAGCLSMVSLCKEAEFKTEPYWRCFFSFLLLGQSVLKTLGLDTLKVTIRKEASMMKRFRVIPQWIVYVGRSCTAIESSVVKRCVPFVSDCLKLTAMMKCPVPNLDRILQSFTSVFKPSEQDLSQLRDAVAVYEAEFGVDLKFRPVIQTTIPKAAPPPMPKQEAAPIDIEQLFLARLREEVSEAKPSRMASHAKPVGKLGMLKQDLVKENQPVKAPLTKKRVNAAVNHTAKAVKLHVHDDDPHSSDVEMIDDFSGAFKDEISYSCSKDVHRSVKLISLEDAGANTDKLDRLKRQDEDCYPAYDPMTSVKKLHRYLLDLDFDRLDDRSLEGFNAKQIPDRFEIAEEYVSIFDPLLLFECRSQLLQAKLEMDSYPPIGGKVMAISSVDDYHEVTLGFESEENDRVVCEHDYLLAELVPSNRHSQLTGVVIQAMSRGSKTEAIVKFKFKPHQAEFQAQLRIGLIWKIRRLCNWVTNIREYTALHSISELRMAKAVLSPSLLPLDEAAIDAGVGLLERTLELNWSQAKAIAVALNNPNPFTLIQGPPGTGKTQTIMGLVGALFGRPYPSLPSKLRPSRLLICAPSNAAIDEIVRRLKAGIYDCYHQKFTPKILRLGSHEMIHEEVRDLTLDATIERNFMATCKDSLDTLQKQKEQLRQVQKQLDWAEKTGSADVPQLKQEYWQLRDGLKKSTGFIETTKQTMRNKVVADAQIVCTTLSSSGIDLLSKLQFEVVIIDEACQAVEVSALIPLQYGCRSCILVGGISSALAHL